MRESRALVTLDRDFGQVLRYPPAADRRHSGTRDRTSGDPCRRARSRTRTPHCTRYAIAGRRIVDRRARASANPSPGGQTRDKARRAAAGALGLDGGRARARHLGLLGGDELRARGARLQPARHAGPPRDFSEDTYRTLTAVDSAVRGLDAAPMAPRGHRGADPQALRGLPLARRADHHFCQQARPRGPRPVRPVGRDRTVAVARRDPGLLADRLTA